MSHSDKSLLSTVLRALHEEAGAKMVAFAGYAMPVQYPAGIIAEHTHTRDSAGLFDVSHMGQAIVRAPDGDSAKAARAMEALVPADLLGLETGRMAYTVLTNDSGGVRDDLILTRLTDGMLLVVNAACKKTDLAYVESALPDGFALERLDGHALLALQGPLAARVIARHCPAAADLRPMHGDWVAMTIQGDAVRCFVTRSGYTGEDGFEISLPNAMAPGLWRDLVAHAEVAPVGLGARDTLRLEAGLCLYGQDLGLRTNPIEAGLAWTIGKRRRVDGGFPGHAAIKRALECGPERRRVGLRPEGRAPVREGTALESAGRPVGYVTSGGYGPTVGGPIAMGYVEAALADPGTDLTANLRGKSVELRIVPLPFVPRGRPASD